MQIVNSEEMKLLDELAINEIGINGLILMENASLSVLEVILNIFKENGQKGKVLIVAGTGNNGGDGFALSRHLINRNIPVSLYIVGNKDKIKKGNALENFKLAKKFNVDINFIENENGLIDLYKEFYATDIIVDAIFGTGLNREVKGLAAKVIRAINGFSGKIISIDVPSGISSDTGQVLGEAVKADYTVTFALPKLGFFFYPAVNYLGKLHLANISIPLFLTNNLNTNIHFLTRPEARNLVPKRSPVSNKRSCGKLLIIGGTKGYTGAIILSAISALYTGAGLIRVATGESNLPIIENNVIDAVKIPLKENTNGYISSDAYKQLEDIILDSDAIIIGPGIGRDKDTFNFIKLIIKNTNIPVVLDADALYYIKDEFFKEFKNKFFILTPHSGELARMLNKDVNSITDLERLQIAKTKSKEWNANLVLKGAPTIIASSRGDITINITGSSALSSAGTGDVLTGIIGGLIVQGLSLYNASRLAAYIQGLAGDIISTKEHLLSTSASQVALTIPQVYKYLTEDITLPEIRHSIAGKFGWM